MLTIGTEVPTSRAASRWRGSPDVWASVGVHPHDAAEADADVLARSSVSSAPRVVAVGRDRLDFFRNSHRATCRSAVFRI